MASSVGNTGLLNLAGGASNLSLTGAIALKGGSSSSGNMPIALTLTGGDASPDYAVRSVLLGTAWKFQTDPTNAGIASGWSGDTFDDSAWGTFNSKASWESQGINYAGFAWYRQSLSLPFSFVGRPVTIKLANIVGDDDFYFNGVRVAGLKGNFKYNNLVNRVYTIPHSLIRAGSNTIAIRIWGGALYSNTVSGLIAGTYTASVDFLRLSARDVGAAISTELPIELYDLSDAQRGVPFEMIAHIDPSDVGLQTQPGISYSLTDFYGVTFKAGTTFIVVGSDGIYRGVILVDATTAQRIYVAGRFTASYEVVDLQAGGSSSWVNTGKTIASAEAGLTEAVYAQTFPAGTVNLPAQNSGVVSGMYTVVIPDTSVVVGNLVVNDTAYAVNWSIQSNLQVGDLLYGNLAGAGTYHISAMSAYQGSRWIRTAASSKSYDFSPIATFTIDKPAQILIGVDTRVAVLPWVRSYVADHLTFDRRDTTALPALPPTFEDTPYGSLKLIDVIDASTDLLTEVHPYMQSTFGGSHVQDFDTPGAPVNSTVSSILGKNARSSDYGWFAYRIGRGSLTVGNMYLLRIEYPEDMPRYCPVEIQVGENYFEGGWKNGVAPDDVYDPWPLSGGWQTYDVIVPLDDRTVGTGGSGDADATKGFWVYLMNKAKAATYFLPYTAGAAVATIKLYEIDPVAHAPNITLPADLPQRVMTVDWEHAPTNPPADTVNYAKLMGYSAVSPLSGIQWGLATWSDSIPGYASRNIDAQGFWVENNYVVGSGNAPPAAITGVPSVHAQYLMATKNLGIDYIPRFEYGGGFDLPSTAVAIGANGNVALPNRYAAFGANLLDPATFDDFKTYIDDFIGQYTATNPQLKGALWRIRSDRMQISYGRNDVTLFAIETGTSLPAGFATYTASQVGAWASTGTIGPAYSTWWQGKRRDFHQQIVDLLKSYRSDLTLYYYNWDSDKFSLMAHDLNSGVFFSKVASLGGTVAYANERADRASFTLSDYLNCFNVGDFHLALDIARADNPWPDYAMRPALYANLSGMQIFAPVNWLPYATDGYINYFQTHDGLAVSNVVSYDEFGARETNPRYEASMLTGGTGPASMAIELLSYFYGDARTLTYTAYNFGRGFADSHRRFAQAFRALPAITGVVAASSDPDVAVRTYSAVGKTYVGVAHKGLAAKAISLSIPGSWPETVKITDLVTGGVTTVSAGAALPMSINAGPMELNAFLVEETTSTMQTLAPGTYVAALPITMAAHGPGTVELTTG